MKLTLSVTVMEVRYFSEIVNIEKYKSRKYTELY